MVAENMLIQYRSFVGTQVFGTRFAYRLAILTRSSARLTAKRAHTKSEKARSNLYEVREPNSSGEY